MQSGFQSNLSKFTKTKNNRSYIFFHQTLSHLETIMNKVKLIKRFIWSCTCGEVMRMLGLQSDGPKF